jgi:hypothetical protein
MHHAGRRGMLLQFLVSLPSYLPFGNITATDRGVRPGICSIPPGYDTFKSAHQGANGAHKASCHAAKHISFGGIMPLLSHNDTHKRSGTHNIRDKIHAMPCSVVA